MKISNLQTKIYNKEITFMPKLDYELEKKKQTIKKLLSELFSLKIKA